MAKRRIAIIGGGIAGLATAFELSRTAQLRARYEVTVYQMGWRLGGKAASGRDAEGRIIEHGLHVWFGFYENAFAMLREVYRECDVAPDSPIREIEDAFVPQRLTLFGDDIHGRHTYWPVRWPLRAGRPGDGDPIPSAWEAAVRLLELAGNVVRDWRRRSADIAPQEPAPARGAAGPFDEAILLASNVMSLAADMALQTRFFRIMVEQKSLVARVLNHRPDDVETRVLQQLLEILLAFMRGVLVDFVIRRRTLDELDEYDFREWLIVHGGDPQIVANSDIVKSLYNTMFQYEGGDLQRPNYAAGTAIQVLLRIVSTHKGAVFFLMRAGMGEVVIAPMYRVLARRGVRFAFFSKAVRLRLDPHLRSIAAVEIERQARLRDPVYRPLIKVGGLLCWPEQPDWNQLVGGDELAKAGVNFESPWNGPPPLPNELLRRGVDFDDIVLAVPPGAFKNLNTDPGLCDELIATNFDFRRMAEAAPLVPTIALQLWLPVSSIELGGLAERAAMVAGVAPFDIWADMSSLLELEPRKSSSTPRSLHYLCGVLGTSLHLQPNNRRDTPSRAFATALAAAEAWLEKGAGVIWPALEGRRSDRRYRPRAFVRANVAPTECCTGSPKGSTKWRLRTDQLPYDNLFLAGSWIATGLNTDCIESAVMSGRQAARAMIGEPLVIPGETFMRPRRDRPRTLASILGEPFGVLSAAG